MYKTSFCQPTERPGLGLETKLENELLSVQCWNTATSGVHLVFTQEKVEYDDSWTCINAVIEKGLKCFRASWGAS